MVSQVDAAFNYNDLNGLNQVKSMARKDDPEALRVVAQQFESMFIGMVLKSMREANDVMASDMLNSNESRFYRDMYDQQLSLNLAQQGGYGLADVLFDQLSRQLPQRDQDFSNINIKSLEDSRRPVLPANQAEPLPVLPGATESRSDAAVPDAAQVLDEDLEASDLSVNLPGKQSAFDSPEEFIQSLLPHAQEAAESLGVDPRILLSQAALETGWGRYMIEDGQGNNSHNFFGIKADARWDGATAETMTHEVFDGRTIQMRDAFRAYEDPRQSFADYANFLQSNPRYQQALNQADDAEAFTRSLQAAGYATDPQYADKILRIADSEVMRLAAADHAVRHPLG
ncbi:flagellar assembly peptidoglycan hydrolase FlgJ [Saccharospirillum sp. HFRX-1]|uniref:flagellar assembly peptidoglycan hydrolase FlgJ n=1 Tax=unclassified Saccharospirillum TaxID=2633430 RepID=UPI003719F882